MAQDKDKKIYEISSGYSRLIKLSVWAFLAFALLFLLLPVLSGDNPYHQDRRYIQSRHEIFCCSHFAKADEKADPTQQLRNQRGNSLQDTHETPENRITGSFIAIQLVFSFTINLILGAVFVTRGLLSAMTIKLMLEFRYALVAGLL